MKELAAYLLALLGGKAGSAKDVTAILSAAGVEADSAAVEQILAAVDGKDLAALIADGKKKLVSVGGGGGSAPVAAATSGGAPSGGAAPKKEEKKEEEEEEVGGAGGLFGGGDDDW